MRYNRDNLMMSTSLSRHLKVSLRVCRRLGRLGVAANGVIILATTLLNQLVLRDHGRGGDVAVGVPLIIGLTLLYLSSLLARRKRTAWTVALPVYGFILGLNRRHAV